MTGVARRLVVAVAAASAGALAAPALAAAAPGTFVTMFSDPGDWIGGGAQRLFQPGNSRIRLSGTARYLTVSVSGGTAGDSYYMDFAGAPGKKLVRGYYTGAQRAPFREAGRPGIGIYGSGRGCNRDSGFFQVRDIHSTRRGAVNRLWLVYEQHCEGGRSAAFGEIRIGEPRFAGPALLTPRTLRWPATDAGRATTAVPVTLRAYGAPVKVTKVALAGRNAGDFSIREDTCTGRTLMQSSCEVWVRFGPTAAGTRSAVVELTDSGGKQHEAVLQGFAYGGQTGLSMHSDPGDYIGGGRDWSYTIANDGIGVGGTRQHVGFGIDGANGDWWYGDFVPAAGDILAAGTYSNATRYPFNGNGPGLDIGGNGRGCNTLTGAFTVNSVTWWDDGSVRTFSISFEQHCEGGPPALHGTFAFRAGDATPLPPWMAGGRARRAASCVVPDVVHRRLAVAERRLRHAHCRTGRLSWRRSRFRKGTVLAQKPRRGRRLAARARVALVVSLGR